MIAFIVAATMCQAADPDTFAYSEIADAFKSRHLQQVSKLVSLKPGFPSEGYRVTLTRSKIQIEASDEIGAMYGGLEVAERIRLLGKQAFNGKPISGKPYLSDRGLNIFLTLPWDYKKNNTDYDPQALVDPKRWWFQDDAYWRMLFDSMARHRMNWLDIHGTWDISVTDAPNLYAYFIQSEKFPEVGVAEGIKAKNLAQLNHVIDMAHSRGIRVSLMAYEARLTIPQKKQVPYPSTEQVAYEYTKEVVEKMIRQAPKLDAIAYRIGESGKGESFFKCYQEAVKASGRNIPLITRTWLTRKANVLPLAEASADYKTQIKYNGEQYGPPYFVAGGRMAGWYSYSFEDYLSASSSKSAKKQWPGNAGWPPNPYREVWQVRANGTHRIFPFYNPDWVRRTVKTMKVGTASGFTVEPLNAYYPCSPDYYLADSKHKWTDYILERDEPYIMMWGRLGYDPNTPSTVFNNWFDEKFGKQGKQIADTWALASRIVPTLFTIYSLGPDHRSHAPEMELGGTVEDFIVGEPFDTFAVKSIRDALCIEAAGGTDGRPSNVSYSKELIAWAVKIRSQTAKLNTAGLDRDTSTRIKELKTTFTMLSWLAEYEADRLKASLFKAQGYGPAEAIMMKAAYLAWQKLSEENYYRPYTERLRMHTNEFHWRNLLPELAKMVPANLPIKAEVPFEMTPKTVAHLPKLTAIEKDRQLMVTLPAKGISRAWLLYKPLPSTAFFHRKPMTLSGKVFRTTIDRLPCGHLLSADVEVAPKTVIRVLDRQKETPYITIPSQNKPTPKYYSGEEALTFLKPVTLCDSRFGTLFLPTRAYRFFRNFDSSMQRKVLEAVKKGKRLIVMQQDYLSGRYPLRWLPVPPKVIAKQSDTFETGGALGLPDIHAPGIMWQAFEATPGWQVHGNGGIASYRLGQGEIWLIQARAFQLAYMPEAARFLGKLVTLDTKKPIVVLDHCGEGADNTSSLFTDLMNALGAPFVTLGEAIAEVQGMDSIKAVPGIVADDDVLGGKGQQMVQKFMNDKVLKAAARPLPTSKEELEKDKPRRKDILMKALGLDPLPPRTPLNVKITGTIKRNGYRIEKVVYESRPGFYVTGHIYIPDGPAGTKFPVILNPHGHWEKKKMEPTVQSRLIFQVLHGYVAFIIDSPGGSWEGNNLVERTFQGSHWDFPLASAGANVTALYVWDMMRGLDYLETRPDCDATRVGITGASGGGLATLYNFAADDRIKVAVPVVYATSLEVSPTNGCPCNHVPATLQIGDRSDVLAIRAPAPVYVIGATDDGEFPPAGTKLTGEKLKSIWGLYGKAEDTGWQVFPGPHDYNKAMRERAMGFFDKHLKGTGDSSPVPEPAFVCEDPANKQFLSMPEVPKGAKTMRDIARLNLASVAERSFDAIVALNGGLPVRDALNLKVVGNSSSGQQVTFASEKGLTIPGLLWKPVGEIKGGVVLVTEHGKQAAMAELGVDAMLTAGYAVLAIDPRGIGELKGLDIRLMTYLGTADSFAMATDVCAAVDALRTMCHSVSVVSSGTAASQAAIFASLIDPTIEAVAGLNGMKSYLELLDLPLAQFEPDGLSLQPMANCGTTLEHLRSLVKCRSLWTYGSDPMPDLVKWLGAK